MADALPRVGSALIVKDEANRILLGKRNKDPQRGNWILPGGKIHAFESIADAAVREIEEETGLRVEVQKQFQVYEIIDPPNEHRIVIYSWARVVGGRLKAADDVSEVKFIPFEQLGEMPLTPLVRKVLQDAGYVGKETQSRPQNAPRETEFLFPMPLAGATRHRHRSRKRRLSTTWVHPGRMAQQASLSFDTSIRD